MAIALLHERDNIYRVDIRGRLRKQDLDTVQSSAADEIRRGGKIRVLIVLRQFEGWEQDANWRDLSFYVAHGEDIERMAIVGDERWKSETLMFVAADLRKTAVKFFPMVEVREARAWLAD